MPLDFTPRWETANAEVSGNPLFWDTVLEESDNFADNTVRAKKGGPFGAQLWAYNKKTGEYVLFGTGKEKQSSNAVISKGLASAHAEAENLSEVNRNIVKKFLGKYQTEDKDWEIIQASSGESCPSCRAKQTLFAQELRREGLIGKDGFSVIYKTIYEQTKWIARFDDKPFDTAFRAANQLGITRKKSGLLVFEAALRRNKKTREMIKSGELVYTPVNEIHAREVSEDLRTQFEGAQGKPFAAVLSADGQILSSAADTRGDNIGQFENGAIMRALHAAARAQKGRTNKPWDLKRAKLITNIRDIGPGAYAESLWYNLSGIDVVKKFTSKDVDRAAREVEGQSNRKTWRQVAAEYGADESAIRVRFNRYADEEGLTDTLHLTPNSSTAQVTWLSQIHRRERSLNTQAERLRELAKQGITKVTFYNGRSRSKLPLHKFIQHSNDNSDYDPGKKLEVA